MFPKFSKTTVAPFTETDVKGVPVPGRLKYIFHKLTSVGSPPPTYNCGYDEFSKTNVRRGGVDVVVVVVVGGGAAVN